MTSIMSLFNDALYICFTGAACLFATYLILTFSRCFTSVFYNKNSEELVIALGYSWGRVGSFSLRLWLYSGTHKIGSLYQWKQTTKCKKYLGLANSCTLDTQCPLCLGQSEANTQAAEYNEVWFRFWWVLFPLLIFYYYYFIFFTNKHKPTIVSGEPSAPKLEGQMGEDGNSIKVNVIKQDDGGSPIRHYLIKYKAVSMIDAQAWSVFSLFSAQT